LGLIQQEKYFVLHEQRQSGKTSFILDLLDILNSGKEFAALYINVEAGQQAYGNTTKGIPIVLSEISLKLQETFQWNVFLNEQFIHDPPENRLQSVLTYITKVFYEQGRKFVLLVDGIDSLVSDTFLTVLRQFRSGYEQRPDTFPASIMLIGVRDIRDYQIFSDGQKKYVVAFNISIRDY